MKKPKIRTYTIKVKEENLAVVGEIESDCWYNAQVKFTNWLRSILKGKYIQFNSEEETCMFGIDFKGPGLYPIEEGQVLLENDLYNTFFDGMNTYTIRSVNE